ncbi:DUF1330 domain-containing protein [Gordonia rubripertincta]|uniref:DUF1330 domain-containing protein n=1 Tax=Gordonia rubripertincta TaxID=36822 RepID=A0ABT4MVL3_GORRU|nr:DUF1330 domain-containing protein [Gordonia rubripertincta]MCZ4551048.1 DUF1330 domain-containing protein [Gordonia rubripertincta]
MSIYFIAIIHSVHNAEMQAEYGRLAIPHLATTEAEQLAAALAKTGEAGRIYELNPSLVDYGIQPLEMLEGDVAEGMSLIKFPNRKAFEDWYYSDEYKEALAVRLQGSNVQAFVVEGTD